MRLYYYEDADAGHRQSLGIEFWMLEDHGLIGYCSEHSITYCSCDEIRNGYLGKTLSFDGYNGNYRPATLQEIEQFGCGALISGYMNINDSWKAPFPYGRYVEGHVRF